MPPIKQFFRKLGKPTSYKPISNLTTIDQILERLYKTRLVPHLFLIEIIHSIWLRPL